MIDKIRHNWQFVALILLLLASTVFLFGLAGGSQDAGQDSNSLTEIQYGIELSGGTEIRAPLNGYTAEDTSVTQGQITDAESQLADELDVPSTEINIVDTVSTNQDGEEEITVDIDVTDPEISRTQFESALEAEGIEYDTLRSGVTESTREETVNVIEDKINEAGLSGGTARSVRSVSGEYFVLVQVPGQDRESVRSLLEDRGIVRIDIYYPDENGYSTEEAVLSSSDFQRIGSPTQNPRTGPHVPVTVTDSAADSFQQQVVETGLSGGGSGSRCAYEASPENTGACLLTVVDGEVVYSSGMAPNLAQQMESGAWAEDRNFIIQTDSLEEANELSLNLRAGGLPAQLSFDEGTVNFISGSQGERFLQYGLIIGILALLGVSGKVAYKYQDWRVAVPMIGSSLSEVYILLGTAAFLGYPIDLAVIGGFVAVIGTGVDDLIIVANEVLSKEEVKSNYAFEKRYDTAFWVIGAAALTTIISLTPLVVLSLGSLSGFAIFTILGILVGVFITRPAYGKTLQYLIVKENQ